MHGIEPLILKVCRAAIENPASAACDILDAPDFEQAEVYSRFAVAGGADPKTLARALVERCSDHRAVRLESLGGSLIADEGTQAMHEFGCRILDGCRVSNLPDTINWILIGAKNRPERQARLVGLVCRLLRRGGADDLANLRDATEGYELGRPEKVLTA